MKLCCHVYYHLIWSQLRAQGNKSQENSLWIQGLRYSQHVLCVIFLYLLKKILLQYWNEELAYLAGLWASVCYFGHGTTNHSRSFSSIGQNLSLRNNKPDGVQVVESWHDLEVVNYNYAAGTCNVICGHYMQVNNIGTVTAIIII